MTDDTLLTLLAPVNERFDPKWSEQTLTDIRTTERPVRRHRRVRRPVAAAVAAAALVVGASTAQAVSGPESVVHHLLDGFVKQPNTTGNGLGELQDPVVVAQFQTENGLFAVWVATPVAGDGVCYAISDGTWDGEGDPTRSELEYGCGGQIIVGDGPRTEELTRPDQLGGFFKDDAGPIVYGIAPVPDVVAVRVRGTDIDRTLPVRPDSLGYGAALPEAASANAVTLTFLDPAGRPLDSKVLSAPVG